MIEREESLEIFSEYDRDAVTIATLGSHSALQILKGAKEEGFRTLALCREGQISAYRRFRVADEVMVLKGFGQVLDHDVLKDLLERSAVLVPHGSLVEYVGVEGIEDRLRVPVLGNRGILKWESDRGRVRRWLEGAGIKMPEETKDPRAIKALSIVKFPGARGGRGYFLVNGYKDFQEKAKVLLEGGKISKGDMERATIQEYIAGANMYLSYFYSPLKGEVELFGIDRRYETNIDGLTRVPAVDQAGASIEPSYVVVGNIPIVARESLLERAFQMGDDIVRISKEIAPPGMLGPFCIETMVTPELEFIAFEISARIVAGTNPFTSGSPYSYLLYGDNMSMGRRMAMELRLAVEAGREGELLT